MGGNGTETRGCVDNLGPAGAGIKRRYFFWRDDRIARTCMCHTPTASLPDLPPVAYAMVLRSKEGRVAHSSVIETLKLCRKLKEKNLNLENDEHLSA